MLLSGPRACFAFVLLGALLGTRAQTASPSPQRPLVWSSPLALSQGVYVYSSPLVVAAAVTISGRVEIRAPSLTVDVAGSIFGVGGGWPGGLGRGAAVGLDQAPRPRPGFRV